MDRSILLLVLCCVVSPILGGTTGEKIHEHMTKKEIESVFHVSHDQIHELDYEVVPVLHEYSNRAEALSSRSGPSLRLKAFDKDYILYLEENDHVLLGDKTQVFMANARSRRSSFNRPRIEYNPIPFPVPEGFKLYHDMETRSAVTIFRDEHNNSHVDGVVGDNVIIRPLPTRVHEEVIKNKHSRFSRSTDEYNYKTTDGYTHHIAVKTSGNVNSFNLGNNRDWQSSLKSKFKNYLPSWVNPSEEPTRSPVVTSRPITTRVPAAKPRPSYPPTTTTVRPAQDRSRNKQVTNEETVYPELLITVDYATYIAHGSNVENLAKYLAAFWNAVDLRFRELSYPAVRLNIAGLIVPQNPTAAGYFENRRLGSKTLQIDGTLQELGNYFKSEKSFPLNFYDIVVGITFRNLGEVNLETGRFNDRITGVAIVEGACKTAIGLATALVKDQGGFSGITTAAHELAHSMGAPHDGDQSNNVAGGPCNWSDGYLMSYKRRDSRGMHWSRCSITALRKFFNSKNGQCLRNVPDPGTPYPKVLPGKMLSRDEQCRKSVGEGWRSYTEEEGNCAVLYCAQYTVDPTDTYIHTMTLLKPPAEGSYCGQGSICLDAQCVKDPKATS